MVDPIWSKKEKLENTKVRISGFFLQYPPVFPETSLFKNKQKMLELCKPVKEMWKKRKKNLCEEHKKNKETIYIYW